MLKAVASAAGLILGGVLLFDVAAYLLFPGVVRRIAPEYANDVGPEVWRAQRTDPYYRRSPSRGFDIAPGARSVAWDPPDVAPHEVWGNSLGCFDDEPPAGATPDIYLAGDSFTWGFSPYETKFGTVIERQTGLLVLACGVTHTGTRHQFDKFRDVAGRLPGWPALVVVNVFTNDIANDFAFPHSTVVDGAWVDDVWLERTGGETRDDTGDGIALRRIDGPREIPGSSDLKYYLKTYSATANILIAAKRAAEGYGKPWRGGVYDLYPKGSFPVRADVAAPHREAVRAWLSHARENGYDLRFALIPDGNEIGEQVYAEHREFLAELGAVAWDFESHLLARQLSPKALYWPYNGHFNPAGNAVYASFLVERMEADARAGALPPRFADLPQITAADAAR